MTDVTEPFACTGSLLTHLMGFLPVNTASGRTKRRSSPEGSFQEVVHAPYRYTSATLHSDSAPHGAHESSLPQR